MSRWGASRRWLRGAAVAAALAVAVMPAAAPAQVQESGFSDVPASHPFHDEIMWLASSGITTGYPDGTFRPGASISRQAMAAFFHRMATAPTGALRELGVDRRQGVVGRRRLGGAAGGRAVVVSIDRGRSGGRSTRASSAGSFHARIDRATVVRVTTV